MNKKYGYSKYKLNRITDWVNDINRLAAEINFMWANSDSFDCSEEEMKSYFVKMKDEIEYSIKELKIYLEPHKEEAEPTPWTPSPEDSL